MVSVPDFGKCKQTSSTSLRGVAAEKKGKCVTGLTAPESESAAQSIYSAIRKDDPKVLVEEPEVPGSGTAGTPAPIFGQTTPPPAPREPGAGTIVDVTIP